jgi:ABC-type sugar transport system ATPase subunit
MSICDKVLVMKDGKIVNNLDIKEASEEIIMQYSSFGKAV